MQDWYSDIWKVRHDTPMLTREEFEALYAPKREGFGVKHGIRMNKRGRVVKSSPSAAQGAHTRRDNATDAAYREYERAFTYAQWQCREALIQTRYMFGSA